MEPMHILFIGAHPDDAESAAGGTLTLLAAGGHHVRMLSVTNGDAGHYAEEYRRDRSLLAERRRTEAEAAAALIGATAACLGVHDGEVIVDLEMTQQMVRSIRRFGPPGQGPDLIITHRPVDYHRDHRYTSRLVLDAAYMLTVPLFCVDTPHLQQDPVIVYHADNFTEEGGPFRPDIMVDIESVLETKARLLASHASQFLEWLPYNEGRLHEVPETEEARLNMLLERLKRRAQLWGERASQSAIRVKPAGAPSYVELFQISEYGRHPTDEELRKLFLAQPR